VKKLACTQPTALSINSARGDLVNEQALRSALDADVIAGAGLNVYWTEPLPIDHWVRKQLLFQLIWAASAKTDWRVCPVWRSKALLHFSRGSFPVPPVRKLSPSRGETDAAQS
jgi:hypothetical protein